MEKNSVPNELISESSPYLLQHAYNPVQWLPFGKAAFERAKKENKLVLISVGYSACHWCHVMEHESFEDEAVAKLMNDHFINIKVDREERSDVDMLYMQAVQLMTGHGGWPLNCFALPDGRPVYGGTYFPKQQWMAVLANLASLYREDAGKVVDYAEKLTEGIRQSELIVTRRREGHKMDKALLRKGVERWKERFDDTFGGPDKAPKFPLPNNYRFLLRFGAMEKDADLLEHVNLTLRKMAFGGICDQLRGGFARYSTDLLWKVPHFEKMLYDNAQLASLYTEAWRHTHNDLYEQTAKDTLGFMADEWLSSEGYFYSAYDADSEGVEGKYYVWTKEELQHLLKEDFELFSHYYHIDELGYWEEENYILMRNENLAQVSLKFNLKAAELEEKMARCREILKEAANSRVKPGLDDKMICSWNAMACTAFAEAYLAFGDERYRTIAVNCMRFILEKMRDGAGGLYRSYKNGQAKIPAFLEDYAFTAEALYHVYLATQEEDYLLKGKALLEQALERFNNPGSDYFYYAPAGSEELLSRGSEVSDNVIPASNSQMANNLFVYGTQFANAGWTKRAQAMLDHLAEEFSNYAGGYSNWGILALHFNYPSRELVIVGKDVDEKLRKICQTGFTNAILAVSAGPSGLPLLKDRYAERETLIYVCKDNTCQLPLTDPHEALSLLA